MGPWLIDVKNRAELEPWLEGEPPTPYRPVVLVVRGDGPAIREFLPNALDAAKLSRPRFVAWVRDEALLDDDERRRFFLGDDDILAAALSADHHVAAWVSRDRISVDDVAFAFEQAERRGEAGDA